MPRPRYRIIAAGVKVVHRWIRERLRNDVWPEDWLRLMQAVIKASRRDPSRYRTVRLSRNAHEILRKLAMRDKLTLSEVIERYLSCVAHVTTQALQIAEQPSSHITSPQAYTQASPPATIKEAQIEID